MIPKNFNFWSRNFWLPEGVDWEHIQDYEKEENLKAANVKDLFPVIYLTLGRDPRTVHSILSSKFRPGRSARTVHPANVVRADLDLFSLIPENWSIFCKNII